MQIVVILLLAIALALLVLGLIGVSSALIVGSIVASLLAVALIVRARRTRIGQPAGADVAHSLNRSSRERSSQRTARPAERTALLRSAPGVGRHAATGRPDDPDPAGYPAAVEDDAAVLGTTAGEEAEQDPPAADTAAPLSGHGQHPVWVVDGRPRYHLAGCDFLLGRPGQPIPLGQAVEDGFTPCSRCDPDNRLDAAS